MSLVDPPTEGGAWRRRVDLDLRLLPVSIDDVLACGGSWYEVDVDLVYPYTATVNIETVGDADAVIHVWTNSRGNITTGTTHRLTWPCDPDTLCQDTVVNPDQTA